VWRGSLSLWLGQQSLDHFLRVIVVTLSDLHATDITPLVD
jgi:hypothetical protein